MPKTPIKAIGSLGVIADPQPQELANSAISDALNIRFRDGSAERITGDIQVFTAPAVTPYYVQLYSTVDKRYAIHAGLAAVYADDGTTRTDITGTAPTGAIGNRWTGGVLNGVLILNNGVDKPMYWGGDTALNLATLPAWTANWKCAVMRPFKNYLVGLDWTKGASRYPQMVKWSSAADPGTTPASWNEADPAVDAGELDLAETPGTMVDALPLGDALIIYKSDSMYAMTYIGGQYIWQFRRLPGEAGMLAKGCACITPQGHLVLTAGDLVLHTGTGVQSVISGKMRRWLFNSMDSTAYAASFLVSNPAFSEAWVCFPPTGSSVCTRALIWNWVDNTFTIRELSNVTYGCSGQFDYASDQTWAADTNDWSSDATTWSQSDMPLSTAKVLLCSTTPLLISMDTGSDFHGTSFTASIERTGLAFDAPDRVKTIRAVFPRVDGTTGQTIYVQIGASMDVEGSITWSDAVPYVIGTTYRVDSFATGRFLAYRVYSTASINWRIRSMDFDIVLRGKY
jgi:hypothetical protein